MSPQPSMSILAQSQLITGAIVHMAILEGAVLLNLVAWLVTGDLNPPAILAGILLFLGVLGFPRQQQLEAL